MSVYFNKARGQWMYDFERHGRRRAGYCIDPRTNAPATSERSAREIEALLKAEIAKHPDSRPSPNDAYTFAEMAANYSNLIGSRRRTWESNISTYVAELTKFFGRDTPIATIDEEQIDAFVLHSRNEPIRTSIAGPRKGPRVFKDHPTRKRTDQTINRYLNCLRAMFNLARRHKKIAALPLVPRLQEPEEEPNPIAPETALRLYRAAPPHLQLVIFLAVNTGMRLREILRLTWDQIDFNTGVIRLTSATKGKRGRVVHLSASTVETLQASRRTPKVPNVVTYAGRPINSVKTGWNKLLADSKVTTHRFHDLRATFCTALGTQPGVTMKDVQDAAGHRSPKTTMRYMKALDSRQRLAMEGVSAILKPQTPAPNEET